MYEVVENTNFFEKKDYFSNENTIAAKVFTSYRVWKTSRNKF